MAPSWMRMANDLPKESSPQPRKCSISKQVPGGGDRQEFGQALDDAEDRRLDQIDIGARGWRDAWRRSGRIGLRGIWVQRFWRNAAAPGNEKSRNPQQFALRATAFYSARLRFSPADRSHADIAASSALPAVALCAADPQRIRASRRGWSRSASGSGARNSCCSIRPAKSRCWCRTASRRFPAPPSSPNTSQETHGRREPR